MIFTFILLILYSYFFTVIFLNCIYKKKAQLSEISVIMQKKCFNGKLNKRNIDVTRMQQKRSKK